MAKSAGYSRAYRADIARVAKEGAKIAKRDGRAALENALLGVRRAQANLFDTQGNSRNRGLTVRQLGLQRAINAPRG